MPVKSSNSDDWHPASEYSNWIDNLPFKVLFGQTLAYNDNLLLLPNGAIPPPGQKRGDAYSMTNVGLLSRFPLGAQAIFINGTYGISRYEHDTGLNSSNWDVNGGWDWVFTSRCAGTLVGSDKQTQAPIEELTSFTANNIRTTAFNEKAKCAVSDNINVILNSGVSRANNSLDTLAVNDNKQRFVLGGIEYVIADLNVIGAQATFTNTDYLNRSPTATPGLATTLDQQSYAMYYRRILSAKLEVDGTLGVTRSTVSSPVQSSSSFSDPTYSVSVKWIATPKFIFQALLSQTVAPPQNIVADFERIRTESLSVSYLFSPRLTFAWALGLSDIKNPTVSGASSPVLAMQKVFFSDLRAIYQVTPLINATGEYRYTDRKDETVGQRATSNLFMLGLTYQR